MLKSFVTCDEDCVRCGSVAGRDELMLGLRGASKMAASASTQVYLTVTKMSDDARLRRRF
jgi:hypothetical protein